MLWGILFNPDYTVGILANKGQLAREILGRLQRAYEYLPLAEPTRYHYLEQR